MTVFEGTRIAVLDTETTGLDPGQGHVLVEVACVMLDGGEIGETWSTLVNPGQPIHPDASAVHGITDAMVRDAPAPAVVAAELESRCAGRALVFHNAAFDLPFLEVFMRRGGRGPLLHPVVDTLGLARGLLGPGGNSLGKLATRFKLEPEATHRALGDALTAARLLRVLAARWEGERGVCTVAELAAASQDALRLTNWRSRAG
jgi:DNA polymerase III epsilon subunit family exonuclease